jgi:hypothetical protein
VVTVELGGDASVKRALILTSRLGYQTATVTLEDDEDNDATAKTGCGGGGKRSGLFITRRNSLN